MLLNKENEAQFLDKTRQGKTTKDQCIYSFNIILNQMDACAKFAHSLLNTVQEQEYDCREELPTWECCSAGTEDK